MIDVFEVINKGDIIGRVVALDVKDAIALIKETIVETGNFSIRKDDEFIVSDPMLLDYNRNVGITDGDVEQFVSASQKAMLLFIDDEDADIYDGGIE